MKLKLKFLSVICVNRNLIQIKQDNVMKRQTFLFTIDFIFGYVPNLTTNEQYHNFAVIGINLLTQFYKIETAEQN